METKKLNPEQVITLNDYPIRHPAIMESYFRRYQARDDKIPLIPVIHKDIVIPCFSLALKERLKKFLRNNPKSKYFMLDGSHRTTASTLSHSPIEAIEIESDSDIKEAKGLVRSGVLLENGIYETNIEGNCNILVKHFTAKPYFSTIKQKTARLITDGLIAQDIINTYTAS